VSRKRLETVSERLGSVSEVSLKCLTSSLASRGARGFPRNSRASFRKTAELRRSHTQH